MHNLMFYVKYIATIQFMILLMGLLLFFGTRELIRLYENILVWRRDHTKVLLYGMLEKNLTLDNVLRDYFRKNLKSVVISMLDIDKTHKEEADWIRLKRMLSDKLLRIEAKSLAKSSSWLKNYLAVICYEFGFNVDEDENSIIQLLKNENLLVSLNMGRILFDSPSEKVINTLIDVLSQSRYVQQSLFVAVIMHEKNLHKLTLIQLFLDRVKKENNPYVKSFCYRVLAELPTTEKIIDCAEEDISSKNIELKLRAIHYLANTSRKVHRDKLILLMNDNDFEVRSTIVRLIGKKKDDSMISILEAGLRDPVWWVRINAANALYEMGKKGIAVLKKQSPENDKFAYDVAKKILLTQSHSSKNKGH